MTIKTTKITKWGNSYGIRISKSLLEEAGLSEETKVDMKYSNGMIKIKPIRNKEKVKYSLKDLCNKIKPQNRHDEIDWGKDLGKENLEPYNPNEICQK